MKAVQSDRLKALLATDEDREEFRRFLATRQGSLPLRFSTQLSRKITLDKLSN